METRTISSKVPVHLVDAFLKNIEEFFAQARGGKTSGQLAAEIRARDEDAGLDALVRLEAIAHGDSGQAGVVARFLAGLYNGDDFPFDLTELRRLDSDLFECCLAVLRLDNNPKVEIHKYLPDGDKRFQKMIRDWNLDNRPPPPPAPEPGQRYKATYWTHGSAPGYRSYSLSVKVDLADGVSTPIELNFTAEDAATIARDILRIHRFAWYDSSNGMPLDRRPGEEPPRWIGPRFG